MKKISIGYAVCLILGLLTSNSIMNILLYCSEFNHYTDDWIKLLLVLFISLVSGLVSFTFLKILKKINKNNIELLKEQETDVLKYKSKAGYIKNINLFTYIIYNLIFSANACMFFSKIDRVSKVYGDVIYSADEVNGYIPFIVLFVTLLLTGLSLIPSNFLINTIFNIKQEKVKKSKIPIKILKWSFTIVFLLILVACDFLYYTKLPEFQYCYTWRTLRLENETPWFTTGFSIYGYRDVRESLKVKDCIIPERLWGKKVIEVYNMKMADNVKIKIPATIPFDGLISFFGGEYQKNCKIEMSGEPIKWFVEDNIIYNQEKTKMNLFAFSDKKLEISEKIEQIYPNGYFVHDEDFFGKVYHNFLYGVEEVTVDKRNPYYYSKNNSIYTIGKNKITGGEITDEDSYLNSKIVYCWPLTNEIIIPENLKECIIIDSTLEEEKTIVIPNELINEFMIFNTHDNIYRLRGTNEFVKEFIVKEGNKKYSTFDGDLYDKSREEIYQLKKRNYKDEKIIFPKTLKRISNNVLESLASISFLNNIVIEFEGAASNDYFIYEDEYLYNKDKSELICTSSINKRIIRIEDTVKSISQEFLEACKEQKIKFSISEDNPYIKNIEEGVIIYK